MEKNRQTGAHGYRSQRAMPLLCVALNICIALIVIHLTSVYIIYYTIVVRSHGGLHMYYICLAFFAAFYGVGLSILPLASLKSRTWHIILCSVISYVAFGLACLAYGFLFDPARSLNTLRQMSVGGFMVPYTVIFPFISGSWLGGAIGGLTASALSRYYHLKHERVLAARN